MTPDLHAAVAERVERSAQRYTSARRALIEVLDAAGRPLTLGEILASGDWPQSSVYRNLGILDEAGVLRRIAGEDGRTRYELSEDLTEHHHHLVCVSCGAVDDLEASPKLERAMERAIDDVTAARGFRAVDHRLDIVGLCARCVDAEAARG